jgi:hypothetical protein
LSGRRAAVVLTIGALLWGGAVVYAVMTQTGSKKGSSAFLPLPQACAGLEIGVHATLAYEGDPARRQDVIGAIKRYLDPQVVRDGLLWDRIETVKGQRDWTIPDSNVRELRAAGIEPELVVLGSPSWANGVKASVPQHETYVPTSPKAFNAWVLHYAEFVTAAAKRYRGAVRRWEIWNEPNFIDFWRPRPNVELYNGIYQALRGAIERVDPGAQVAVGGLGSPTLASTGELAGRVFLRQLASLHAPVDAVAVHVYPTDDHAPAQHVAGQNNFDDIQRMYRTLVENRHPVPVWVTEFGWSSKRVGPARQAQYVGRSLDILERRYPFVPLATYFLAHDLPKFHQGLLDERLKPKPAARVFRQDAQRLRKKCAPPAKK